ncbi:hypothetical protein TrRE_jg3122, partial [Triparma retinervis]
YALVSASYHLCNLNDIHFRSPLRSVLNPLTSRVSERVGSWNRFVSNRRPGPQGPSLVPPSAVPPVPAPAPPCGTQAQGGEDRRKGWTTVEFVCSPYPYLDEREGGTNFLAKCFLIGQELVPILVNIQGVVNKREFFQRSNYVMLSNIRRSLML